MGRHTEAQEVSNLRVTIGEMLGEISAQEGQELEQGLDKSRIEKGQDAEKRHIQGRSDRKLLVVEVLKKRPRAK